MKDSEFRLYARQFFAVAGGGLLLVMALNFIVDPYYVFGTNKVGIFVAADRQSKPRMVREFPHNAVLMGTSKAAMIDTTQLKGYTFFSATFGGASIEELYSFAFHHIHDSALAVIAIDFWMFDRTPTFENSDSFGPRDLAYFRPYLVKLETLGDSLQSISRFLRGRPLTFRPDGSYLAEKWERSKDRPNPAALAQIFAVEKSSYENFKPSGSRLDLLRKLKQLLNSRGVATRCVINPMHAKSLEILRNSPAWPYYSAWKNDVFEIFPDTIDLMDSKYSDPANFFNSDPLHFRPHVGVEFMNREVLSVLNQE